jgi:ubiquinone/menaquinone biosynthesis C-methylase UbiE
MIDDRAARGFVAAEHYDAHRPSYPPEAVDFIRQAGRVGENSTVVDLGAGSGLITRLLSPAGRLIAVEPLPEMRRVLRAQVPQAEVLAGSAEAIPLPSATADTLVVAQAFHWFANRRALCEITRVLKTEGRLVLVWNVKDPRDPLMRSIDDILAPHRLGSPGHDSTPWREVLEAEDSPFVMALHQTFSFEEQMAVGRLKARALSASYIALLDGRRRELVLTEIEKLVERRGDGQPLTMKYLTEVYVARRR